eukprot:scaffold14389_cov151-Skeletonema_marinoi.AAC.9
MVSGTSGRGANAKDTNRDRHREEQLRSTHLPMPMMALTARAVAVAKESKNFIVFWSVVDSFPKSKHESNGSGGDFGDACVGTSCLRHNARKLAFPLVQLELLYL